MLMKNKQGKTLEVNITSYIDFISSPQACAGVG